MPQNGWLARRVLPKLTARFPKSDIRPAQRKGPRLYNGKRLVKTSQSALWRNHDLQEKLKKSLATTHDDGFWRKHVSQDVADFIDDMEAQGTKLLPEEQYALLTNPVKYFSRPQNVPGLLRKQVYFPDFSITLLNRSRDPYFAQFHAPMSFTKLDMKHYLKEVYNVDVVHVRSQIKFGRIGRNRQTRRFKRGPTQKFMIVQLVKPFTWPVKESDIDRNSNSTKQFYAVEDAQQGQTRDFFKKHKDEDEIKSIAEQARELLEGKTRWKPTWEEFPRTKRMMHGSRGSTSIGAGLPPP